MIEGKNMQEAMVGRLGTLEFNKQLNSKQLLIVNKIIEDIKREALNFDHHRF